MNYVLGKYIFSEEEVSLLRKAINKSKGSSIKFDALQLVKSQKS